MIHNDAVRIVLNGALLMLAGWWGLRIGRAQRPPINQELPIDEPRPLARAGRERARIYETGRIPGAVFTDPEVASVGLTEQEAVALGRRVEVGKQHMRGVGRARAMGETEGFRLVEAVPTAAGDLGG